MTNVAADRVSSVGDLIDRAVDLVDDVVAELESAPERIDPRGAVERATELVNEATEPIRDVVELPRSRRRRPAPGIVLLVVLGALVVGGAIVLLYRRRDASRSDEANDPHAFGDDTPPMAEGVAHDEDRPDGDEGG